MDRQRLVDLTLRFTDAFNRDDLDGVMAFFADDAVYDEFDGKRSVGPGAIREAFRPQFEGRFGSVRFRQEDLFVDADAGKAMIAWTCTLTTPERSGGWRGLDLLHFGEDGLLRQKLTYAKAERPLLRKAGG